ncbi:LruC domain-containing protein [Pseudoalteromonas ulvae]|uniref:LruC domain-containing protein n=1 Tax=Pseudoalteromonas ulvae TaxID=107327 RepID=A0A244CSA8_PSEDV|nr:LruC domain-containing protein [Pseudoalteromonas ulvae]OUL58492.1 LruC domain-containing protein [Pseudoalteromonas ulvae]
MKQLLLGCACLASVTGFAAPFDTCPSKAFLVQQNKAVLFGVNLATGSALTLANEMGTNSKINAIGFSVHDRYLYGWGYQNRSFIRIGKDYQEQPITTSGFPNTDFFVGDVSVLENAYYAYKKGSSLGLYRLELDQSSPDYLQAQRVIDGGQLNLNIFDLAFHPSTGDAFSVDSRGILFQIDVATGQATAVADVGESGTFGAVYFDVEGNFYISRNQDGHVFRIDVAASQPVAQFFAFGPISGNNDGARCATAPIIDEDDTSIDFGDAPDSYGTTLASNGARHEHNSDGLFLGSIVNGEAQPKASDDSDDGVQFVTTLETGFDALIVVSASQSGYLNGWFDWNNNGQFDTDEQALSAEQLQAGNNTFLISVPDNAVAANTWARFRVTEGAVVGAIGGVGNGEVEDYSITVLDSGISRQYYPSQSGWVTLAYEDLWPEVGDYDFNDVVLKYRTITDTKEGQVVRYIIEGQLVALGASYHNGFAVRLAGVAASQINQAVIHHQINQQTQTFSSLEANRNEAIIVVMPDTKNWAASTGSCRFFRTQSGCENDALVDFRVSVPLSSGISENSAPSGLLDPFIFAVNGQNHGPFVNPNNARGWEVHLKNQSPTEAFDSGLFGQADDRSQASAGFYYQSESGLPWAMEMGANWAHPKEKIDLLLAYPEFAEFTQSSGVDKPQWFSRPAANQTINN